MYISKINRGRIVKTGKPIFYAIKDWNNDPNVSKIDFINKDLIRDLQQQIVQKDKSIFTLQNKIKNLETNYSKFNNECMNSKDMLDSQIKQIINNVQSGGINVSAEEYKGVKERELQLVTSFKQRMTELNSMISHLQSENAELQKNYSTRDTEFKLLKNYQSEAEENYKILTLKTSEYETNLNKANKTKGDIELKLNQITKEYNNSMLKINQLQKENLSLATEIEEITVTNDRLKRMLEQKEIQMVNEMNTLKSNLALMADEKNQNKILEFTNMIGQSKNTIINLEREINDLKNQLRQYLEEAQIYKENTENVQKSFLNEREILNVQIQNAKIELKNYESELNVLKNKEIQYNNLISTKDGFIAQLETQLRDQINQFQYIEQNYKNNINESEYKIQQLSQQYENAYSQVSQKYNTDINQSNFEKVNYENEVLNLKNIIDALKDQNMSYESNLRELSLNNSKLSIEIQSLTSQHNLSQKLINELKVYNNETASKYQSKLEFINSNKEMENYNYNESILQYTNLITKLQGEIASLTLENVRLNNIIVTLSQSVNDKDKLLKEKTEELNKINNEFNILQNKINEILKSFNSVHEGLYIICSEVSLVMSVKNFEENFGKSLFEKSISYSITNFMQGKSGFAYLLQFLFEVFSTYSKQSLEFANRENTNQIKIKNQIEEITNLKKRYEDLEIKMSKLKNDNIDTLQNNSEKYIEILAECEVLKEKAHTDQRVFNEKIEEEQKKNKSLIQENENLSMNIISLRKQINDYITRLQMFEKDAIKASNITSNFSNVSKLTMIEEQDSELKDSNLIKSDLDKKIKDLPIVASSFNSNYTIILESMKQINENNGGKQNIPSNFLANDGFTNTILLSSKINEEELANPGYIFQPAVSRLISNKINPIEEEKEKEGNISIHTEMNDEILDNYTSSITNKSENLNTIWQYYQSFWPNYDQIKSIYARLNILIVMGMFTMPFTNDIRSFVETTQYPVFGAIKVDLKQLFQLDINISTNTNSNNEYIINVKGNSEDVSKLSKTVNSPIYASVLDIKKNPLLKSDITIFELLNVLFHNTYKSLIKEFVANIFANNDVGYNISLTQVFHYIHLLFTDLNTRGQQNTIAKTSLEYTDDKNSYTWDININRINRILINRYGESSKEINIGIISLFLLYFWKCYENVFSLVKVDYFTNLKYITNQENYFVNGTVDTEKDLKLLIICIGGFFANVKTTDSINFKYYQEYFSRILPEREFNILINTLNSKNINVNDKFLLSDFNILNQRDVIVTAKTNRNFNFVSKIEPYFKITTEWEKVPRQVHDDTIDNLKTQTDLWNLQIENIFLRENNFSHVPKNIDSSNKFLFSIKEFFYYQLIFDNHYGIYSASQNYHQIHNIIFSNKKVFNKISKHLKTRIENSVATINTRSKNREFN